MGCVIILILFGLFQISFSLGYLSCHKCRDQDCASQGVCKNPGHCDHSCIDCRIDDDCGWTGGSKPHCSDNTCVQCASVSHCASNSNCDVSCDSNICNVHSTMDCTLLKETPHCLIGNSKCVECLDDSHCGSEKPYCSPSNRCEECLNNFNCRNATRCNAICVSATSTITSTTTSTTLLQPGVISSILNTTCQAPPSEEYLHCQDGTVCYDWLGQCYESCSDNSQCPPSNSTAINGNRCNSKDGKCYLCTTDNDCNTSANQTCGAYCKFNADNHQYVCTSGTSCSSIQNCVLDSTQYICRSLSSILLPTLISLSILLILV